jgi:hypothetical protein
VRSVLDPTPAQSERRIHSQVGLGLAAPLTAWNEHSMNPMKQDIAKATSPKNRQLEPTQSVIDQGGDGLFF